MKRITPLSFAMALPARRTLKILALTVIFLAFGLGLPSGLSETSHAQTAPERPNIIFILTDDLDARSVEHMPALQSLLVDGGTTFSNAFVTKSLCCPSRASILLGQYPHNHQVLTNSPPLGGFETFRDMGHEKSTIATWLHSGGYQTALIGKYLNGYSHATEPLYVPPGWDHWEAGGNADTMATLLPVPGAS
jgi:N-acetylglucosamine-6-sulfatase